MLIRIREYIRSKKLNTCISEPTYGERNISGTASEKVISEITTDNPEDVTTACSATAEKDLPIQTNDMDLNEVRTAFEQHLDDISGITEWLRNRAFSSAQKRDVFRRYMNENPENAMRLVKATVTSEENTVTLWAEITDRELFFGLYPVHG